AGAKAPSRDRVKTGIELFPGAGQGGRNSLPRHRSWRQRVGLADLRPPHHLAEIAEIVQAVEQLAQPSRRRDPEQRARLNILTVVVAVRPAARHAHEVAGLGLGPGTLEIEIERALEYVDELVLGRMDVGRHKSS